MIDLHAHILPGIDDGARDLDEFLTMARLYVTHGFHQVVATPHALTDSLGEGLADAIALAVEKLNRTLRNEAVDLVLKPGMEIALTPEVKDFLAQGRLLPLAGSRYVLIEPPFESLPIHWEQVLFDIVGRNYRILLAHPERCAALSREPGLFEHLIETGVYLQVNWGSFLGLHGHAALKTARHLARMGYIHCLATDSHDTQNRSAAMVREAFPKVADLVGQTNLDLLSIENPARVIADETLVNMAVSADSRQAARGRNRWMFWKK